MSDLLKTKSFWTGVVGIVTAVGAYLSGEMSVAQAIQTVLGSFAVIFLRDGIEKTK